MSQTKEELLNKIKAYEELLEKAYENRYSIIKSHCDDAKTWYGKLAELMNKKETTEFYITTKVNIEYDAKLDFDSVEFAMWDIELTLKNKNIQITNMEIDCVEQ